MCRLRNIALESVTDGRTDIQTTDKVIPMCHFALQATQKFDRNQEFNDLFQVFLDAQRTKITALACDLLRHFRLLCNC